MDIVPMIKTIGIYLKQLKNKIKRQKKNLKDGASSNKGQEGFIFWIIEREKKISYYNKPKVMVNRNWVPIYY